MWKYVTFAALIVSHLTSIILEINDLYQDLKDFFEKDPDDPQT